MNVIYVTQLREVPLGPIGPADPGVYISLGFITCWTKYISKTGLTITNGISGERSFRTNLQLSAGWNERSLHL